MSSGADSGCFVPSKVTNASKILAFKPPNEELKEVIDDNGITEKELYSCNGGKWLLYADKEKRDGNGYTELDRFWFQIKKVIPSNHIEYATCSTALSSSTASDNAGVIKCFTKDFEDKMIVKMAGKAITDKVWPKNPLYYKTNTSTARDKYLKKGSKNISIYRCLQNGSFYERAEDGSWTISW